MKFRLFTISGSFLIAIALFFASCTKEGPAGPAGPAGPQGAAGPTGATGTQGPAGTANVFYSNWLDVPFTTDADSSTWTAEITAARLVDSVIQRGDVKVYWNIGTSAAPVIVPLPVDALAFGVILTPIFQTGRIRLFASDNLSTVTLTNGQKESQFRYIIIPGGVPTGRLATVDWKDYNAVKAYLGLKD